MIRSSAVLVIAFACLAATAGAADNSRAKSSIDTPTDGFPRDEIIFPKAASQVDVRETYGAKGDGKTDDTAALQKAISENLGYHSRILYLPAGTYLISKPLWARKPNGERHGGLKIFGQHRDRCIIRLQDACPGFADPANPMPLIRFMSNPEHGDEKGNGNSGHWNSLVNLTISTGCKNPGANGIAWLPSNVGTLRDVTIRSEDAGGPLGVDMTMAWPGPGLMHDVVISGFDTGVRIPHHEYGITINGLFLERQRTAGLHIDGNAVHARRVTGSGAASTVLLTRKSPHHRPSQLVLLDSTVSGNPGIAGEGTVYARNVRNSGGAPVLKGSGPEVRESLTGEAVQQVVPSPESALNLPVPEVPDVPWDPPATWALVRNASECQIAIDKGATTICFPFTETRFDKTVVIRGNVRRIIGMLSNLWSAGTHPCWRFEGTSSPTTVLEWMASGPIEIASPPNKALVLRHHVKTRVISNTPDCGPLFIEDVCSSPWVFTNPMNVWAYQWNPECSTTSVTGKGTRFWVLGWKTEQPGIQFDLDGGALELLGGLVYPCQVVPKDRPMFAFKDTAYSLFMRFASYGDNRIHETKVRDERDGKVVSVPEIGRGLILGWTPKQQQEVVAAMRGEDPKSKKSTAPPRPVQPVLTAKVDAMPAWDARLRARLGELIAIRKGPVFIIGATKQPAEVRDFDGTVTLTLFTMGSELQWSWAKLTIGDKARLAEAAKRPFEPADNALAAYWLLADGRSVEAERCLSIAGKDAAVEVKSAFDAAIPPSATDDPQ